MAEPVVPHTDAQQDEPGTSRGTDRGSGGGIGRQAVWNYAVFALSKSLTLIMTVVLARLLGPAEFGLFTLALLVMMLFDYVRDLGIAVALVQRREPWSQLAPTGLTLSAGFGLLVGAGAVLAAPWTAAALGDPELTALVRVLAIGLVISALGVLPMAVLRRELDFRRRMLPEVCGALAKTTLAIGLAAGGYGVWSLIWAQLVASVVTTVGYWVVVRPPLRFGFDRTIAGVLVRFGLPVTAVSFLSFAVTSVDYAAIGRRLGSTDLGYYTLAYRLPELLVINLCVVVGDVLFSALSRLQHDRPALVAKYLTTLRTVVALTSAIGLGMAAVAPDVVGLLYGAAFAPAADELAVLAIFAVLYSVNFHAGDAYKALGRPGLLTWLGVGKLTLLVPAVWWAAGRSTLLVAAALVAVEAVLTVVRLLLVRQVLGVGLGRHLAVLAGPVTAAVAMATLVLGTAYVLPDWLPAVRLAVLVPVGLVGYLGLLRLLAPSLWATARSTVRRRPPDGRAPDGRAPDGPAAEGRAAEGRAAQHRSPTGSSPAGGPPAGGSPAGERTTAR